MVMGAKERNKKYVLEKAREIFLERGITGVSMADIAKEADFGVASVYRYFGNRKALILECAVSLWKDKRDKMSVVYENHLSSSGIEQIIVLTKYFSWLIVNDKAFSRFLLLFDSFLMTEDTTQEERKEYDAILIDIYRMFENAYKTGLSDGTVRDIGSFQDFYFAATQSLISLSQRLTMRGTVDVDDESLHDKVKLLVNMFTTYVSNEK